MTTAIIVVLAVLAVLAVAAVLGDRVLAAMAERKAADYLAAPFGHRPTVRVLGAPFLSQAVRGRYDSIEVSGGGLRIGEMAGATLDARISGALLPLGDLLAGRTTDLPCARVAGRIVIPYGEVARASHIPGLALTFEDSRLVASASLPVPGINQLARVSGQAVLSILEGRVWLRVRRLSVAGISLPSLLVTQLLPTLSVGIAVPSLPFGLQLDELIPEPGGLVVLTSASDVVLAPSAPAAAA